MEKFTLPEITLTPLFYLELKQNCWQELSV